MEENDYVTKRTFDCINNRRGGWTRTRLWSVFSGRNHDQLQFVEGSAISIVTEKFDFKEGEQVLIKIINSGTVPLVFSDASYGLRITGLDGVLYYTPVAAQVISTLEPMGRGCICLGPAKD